eukprot:TRINITY_DN19871_c0_g1_i1.p1 TRINITY_DN19871_c0_g1~~TRINITY_DN19871_c0_g1_i1.p1  ORF type:complete len:856 (-),score=106.34 TRINITY_DN19871_c0_g1_i1:39-2606(-)
MESSLASGREREGLGQSRPGGSRGGFNWDRSAFLAAAARVESRSSAVAVASAETDPEKESWGHGLSASLPLRALVDEDAKPPPCASAVADEQTQLLSDLQHASKAGENAQTLQEPSASRSHRRIARLAVHPTLGAGLDVSFADGAGYIIEAIADAPGQPELREGDVVVAVAGRSLTLTSEDEADEVLAAELRDGAEFLVERCGDADPPSENACAADAASHSDVSRVPLALPADSCGSDKADSSLDMRLQGGEAVNDNELVPPCPESLPLLRFSCVTDSVEPDESIRSNAADVANMEVMPPDTHVGELGVASKHSEEGMHAENALPRSPTHERDAVWTNPDARAQNLETHVNGGASLSDLAPPSHTDSALNDDSNVIPAVDDIDTRQDFDTRCRSESEVLSAELAPPATSLADVAGTHADEEACWAEPPPRNAHDVSAESVRWTADECRDALRTGESTESCDHVVSEGDRNMRNCEEVALPSTANHSDTSASFFPRRPAMEDSDIGFEGGSVSMAAAPQAIAATTQVSVVQPCNPPEALHPTGTATQGFPVGRSAVDSTDVQPITCKVKDLHAWLEEMSLQEYGCVASRWCDEMGAASLEEIAENVDDFGAEIALKPIERQRVRKWAARFLGENGIAAIQAQPSGGSLAMGHSHNNFFGPSSRVEVSASRPTAQENFVVGAPAALSLDADASSFSAANAVECASDTGASSSTAAVYTARSVRLAMDASGITGLDLSWDEEWGISVQKIDPLPGQPGLAPGDYIVAIDGCSLRHRSHSECDALFSERLRDGVSLSVVTPASATSQQRPRQQAKGTGKGHGWGGRPAWPPDLLAQGRGRHRGGFDANKMWSRFRRPPW